MKDDDAFRNLSSVVDNVMKESVKQGLGTVKQSTSVSTEMEEKMWQSDVWRRVNSNNYATLYCTSICWELICI